MVKLHVSMLLLALASATTEAQVRRRAPRVPEPSAWVSLSAGIFGANSVTDGATESTWDFGQASSIQYRASLERAIRNQGSIGVTGTYVRVPFVYIGGGGPDGCGGCDSHLDLLTLAASFHVGGGTGLHQVLEGSVGVVQYRNFRRDSNSAPLAPLDGNVDPYFGFGYGFGYTLNPAMQVSVVQDVGLGLHERSGLTSQQSNTLRLRNTRLNFRYGFANRARRR